MFWPYVVDLKQFYSSALGHKTAWAIGRAIGRWWAAAKDDTVIGVGYAVPYLEAYLGESVTLAACMPSAQGAIAWPAGRPNLSLLVDETALPIPDNVANRALVVHALENTEHARALLEELWRALTPGGRLLVVVPNRHGVWARAPGSPFSQGRPYSAAQLKTLLEECQFTPTRALQALYFFPSQRPFWLRLAAVMEAAGFWLGGVVLMEAEKQLYAAIKEPVTARRPAYRYATLPKPAMSFMPSRRL